MEYNHKEIESRWQQYWRERGVYHVTEDVSRPKFYVLDMFPYPSGAGLHVGHPLGYIASDIYARYKRQCGYNVLHPMGYDAYGLPAEQYAIQTGQHPEVTTNQNIAHYREQLDKIGFSFDWDREVRTCDPAYYKWTQWAFLKMFASYYDTAQEKARPIAELVSHFEAHGTDGVNAACGTEHTFTAAQWAAMSRLEREQVLMDYRIAYRGNTMVNWCPALGTVLANDEVSEGVSVRGGHPVEQKMMSQWCLRVSAYAKRLLDDLDTIEWSDSLKETQRNWIGRSEGAEMHFPIAGRDDADLLIFTTRADTIFGVTFMVLAPESEYVGLVTTAGQRAAVEAYLDEVRHKTERERMIDKRVSGVYSGSNAVNPVTGEEIPIYISDYVLAGYGTGAIMAVPAHDSRDYAFARHFNLPVIPLIEGADVSQESFDAKEGIMTNSSNERLQLNGLTVKQAIARTKEYIEQAGIGRVKVNYRLRDAIFSRQRYWGEPFPIYYDEDGMPQPLDESVLPLRLPEVDKFLPTESGEPPLGRALNWVAANGRPLELCTMPGFAGSSAYYLRYMDPHNDRELVSREANDYWQQVDLYVGGSEHATGHLIYSRFWNKFLYDCGLVCKNEPYRKLVNQGMIQGSSRFVYRVAGTNTFVSAGLRADYDTTPIHVDVNIVDGITLDTDAFKQWRPEYATAEFILEDGRYLCGTAIEKMSKSYYNVVNPDNVIEKWGADSLRLFEMFLGPIEASKPWDDTGIQGSNRFIKRVWALCHDRDGNFSVSDAEPTAAELKVLHGLIKKVTGDIEAFSYNTSVAAFMEAVNALTPLKCDKRAVIEPLVALLAPFTPHVAEELWHALGHDSTVCDAPWPAYDERFLKEDTVKMGVSFNGKPRYNIEVPADATREQIQEAALSAEGTARWLPDGATPKKVIVVPGKLVNIVV